MSEAELNHVLICPPIAELIVPFPTAVIRTCRVCQTEVWYNPAGDPQHGQRTNEFECTDCAAERYQRGETSMPGFTEASREQLRSVGVSDQRIDDVLFAMTIELIGRKRRPHGSKKRR